MTDLHQSLAPMDVKKRRNQPMKLSELLIPRDHGVWSMLLIALIVPPPVLNTGGAAWWFSGASIILFFARRPWEVWWQSSATKAPPKAGSEKARPLALVLAGFGLLLGGWGLVESGSLLTTVLAVVIAGLAGIGAWMESLPRRGRGKAMSRTVGTASIAGLILLQEAAAFGHFSPRGLSLTVIYLSFFLMSGVRIRSLVRARNVEGFRRTSLALNAAVFAGVTLASLVGWFPLLAPVSLLSGLIQAFRILRRDNTPVNTMRMGIGEIMHSTGFVVILIITYRLAGT